jgi:hypothetical protein
VQQKKTLYVNPLVPGLRPERQVRRVRGVPARHDRERVGLAQQRQSRVKQGIRFGQTSFWDKQVISNVIIKFLQKRTVVLTNKRRFFAPFFGAKIFYNS